MTLRKHSLIRRLIQRGSHVITHENGETTVHWKMKGRTAGAAGGTEGEDIATIVSAVPTLGPTEGQDNDDEEEGA